MVLQSTIYINIVVLIISRQWVLTEMQTLEHGNFSEYLGRGIQWFSEVRTQLLYRYKHVRVRRHHPHGRAGALG